MSNITRKLIKFIQKEILPTYFRDDKFIPSFVENRKEFLLKLKLPPRLFLNSSLIDFGCGMGQNTLVYDYLGASCTLLEFDKYSLRSAKKLFDKFARNDFEFFNVDLFEFSSKKNLILLLVME